MKLRALSQLPPKKPSEDDKGGDEEGDRNTVPNQLANQHEEPAQCLYEGLMPGEAARLTSGDEDSVWIELLRTLHKYPLTNLVKRIETYIGNDCNLDLLLISSQIYHSTGCWDDAKKRVNKIHSLDSRNKTAWIVLGHVHYENNAAYDAEDC